MIFTLSLLSVLLVSALLYLFIASTTKIRNLREINAKLNQDKRAMYKEICRLCQELKQENVRLRFWGS